jgi:hypothetical protein
MTKYYYHVVNPYGPPIDDKGAILRAIFICEANFFDTKGYMNCDTPDELFDVMGSIGSYELQEGIFELNDDNFDNIEELLKQIPNVTFVKNDKFSKLAEEVNGERN